jgi:hypothetical protein
MMKKNFWRNLIEMSLNTEEDEIDCMECLEILDQYVDLLDAGQEPCKVLPKLEQHLSVCNCCHAELKGILIALKTAADASTGT